MDCSACLGGHYCGIVGQTEPTGLCTAGYYCKRYANMSTPNQGYDADVCPQGRNHIHYPPIFNKSSRSHRNI